MTAPAQACTELYRINHLGPTTVPTPASSPLPLPTAKLGCNQDLRQAPNRHLHQPLHPTSSENFTKLHTKPQTNPETKALAKPLNQPRHQAPHQAPDTATTPQSTPETKRSTKIEPRSIQEFNQALHPSSYGMSLRTLLPPPYPNTIRNPHMHPGLDYLH